MTPKYPIKAFDGTSYSDVQVLNVPAGAIDANGEIDLGQGIKVYRALLTQASTDAPVATVLENTLGGTVVWTYDAAGEYDATLTGAFTDGKTFLLTQPTADADGILNGLAVAKRLNANTVRMYVAALNDLTSPSDALLLDTPIQITVFP